MPLAAHSQLRALLIQALETGAAMADIPAGDGAVLHCEIHRLARPVSGGVATIAFDLNAAEPSIRLHEDELNHRVRNSLHVISAFVSSQRRQDGGSSDGYAAIQSRINAVAALYEVMAQAGRGGAVHADLFFATLADGFRRSLLGDAGAISIRVQAAPALLEPEQAGPIALIVNELVTNAVKHAFPDGRGEISLMMEETTAGQVIVVSDNGVGVAQGATPGLGSRCISAFVRQLHGNLSVHADAHGSVFTLTLAPLPRRDSGAPNDDGLGQRHRAVADPRAATLSGLPHDGPRLAHQA